jgi:Na+(H+)/acetate symporter ActP
MSIENTVFGIGCGQEIYDTPDEETWVQCKIGRAKLGMIIGLIILVIIVLMFVFLGGHGTTANVLIIFLGFLAAGFLIYSTYHWTERFARTEWKRFELAINTEMKNLGASREKAVEHYIDKIQQEKNRRAQLQAASQQAGAILSVASALRRH